VSLVKVCVRQACNNNAVKRSCINYNTISHKQDAYNNEVDVHESVRCDTIMKVTNKDSAT